MRFLLDTDICSAHLRNVSAVTSKFMQYTGRLNISVVTLGELSSWTLRDNSPARYHQGLLTMMSDVTVVEVDQAVAWRFGEVRAQLLDQGRPIASVDRLIAATAIVHDMTVVTHNMHHFAHVPGLSVADWLNA